MILEHYASDYARLADTSMSPLSSIRASSLPGAQTFAYTKYDESGAHYFQVPCDRKFMPQNASECLSRTYVDTSFASTLTYNE